MLITKEKYYILKTVNEKFLAKIKMINNQIHAMVLGGNMALQSHWV